MSTSVLGSGTAVMATFKGGRSVRLFRLQEHPVAAHQTALLHTPADHDHPRLVLLSERKPLAQGRLRCGKSRGRYAAKKPNQTGAMHGGQLVESQD